jgi:hypothetical protein
MKATLETLRSLEEELQFFNTLTESQACELYNVDYKNEALQYITDYWN